DSTTFTASNGNSCSVQVNIPPTSGNFTNPGTYPGFVEVIVTYNLPRVFNSSRFFGSGTVAVSARAVARARPAYQNVSVNILTLNSSASPSLNLNGSKTVMSVPGAIYVDSSASGAVSGNGTAISSSSVDIVGTSTDSSVYAPTSGSTANVYQSPNVTSVADP